MENMKKIIAILLISAIIGCKKKNETPAPTTPVCETKTKTLEGVYTSNATSHDTVRVVFNHNNCPTENQNVYLAYGVGKALKKATGTSVVFDFTKVYTLTSNELSKSATTSGVTCNWGIMADGKLQCNYSTVGAIILTKIN